MEALRNVNFSVEPREYVAIMGESGSGKTTLLNILAALDRPTSGKVFLKGRELGTIKEKEMAAFRRQNLGFVFKILICSTLFRCRTIFSFRWSSPGRSIRRCAQTGADCGIAWN